MQMQILGLTEKLEATAGRGKYHKVVVIYHSDYERKSKSLLKEGFAITQLPTTRDSKKAKYNISWKRCAVSNLVPGWNSDTIIREQPELTQGQRLWLMSTEAINQKVM